MPQDSTPRGDEMVRRLPERKFPEPKKPQGTDEDSEMGHTPRASESSLPSSNAPGATDISQRPSLPDHPQQMAADIEDEDDDPVIDSGPGITDGVR